MGLSTYSNLFLEVIIGIGFDNSAIKILKKKKNILIDASKLKIKNISNVVSHFDTFLLQSSDNKIFTNKDFEIVSKKKTR